MNTHMNITTALTAILAASTIGVAQTGGTSNLPWSTIDSGGVVNAAGGSFTLSGTIGQGQDAGEELTGGSFALQGGFWAIGRDFAADCPGDADGDHIVDGADLLAIINNFGSTGPEGDVTGDGLIDGADLLDVINNFGTVCE